MNQGSARIVRTVKTTRSLIFGRGVRGDVTVPPQNEKPSPSGRIDKSEFAIPEPQRMRDKRHLQFVAKQPCLVCARIPAFAHEPVLPLLKQKHSAKKSAMSSPFLSALSTTDHCTLQMTKDPGGSTSTLTPLPSPVA